MLSYDVPYEHRIWPDRREAERLMWQQRMARSIAEQKHRYHPDDGYIPAGSDLAAWVWRELQRFTYKPDVCWLVHANSADSYPFDQDIVVKLVMWVTNTYEQDRDIEIVMVARLPHFVVHQRDPDELAGWFQNLLFEMERHESREWLRRDGQIFDDPHKRDSR